MKYVYSKYMWIFKKNFFQIPLYDLLYLLEAIILIFSFLLKRESCFQKELFQIPLYELLYLLYLLETKIQKSYSWIWKKVLFEKNSLLKRNENINII